MTLKRPAAERVLEKTVSEDRGFSSECWCWQGYLSPRGYGKIHVLEGKGYSVPRLVHRVVYTALKGEIPDGLTLDHLCEVPHCVNPAHLEPVTSQENRRRYAERHPGFVHGTHCKHGHPWSDNRYLWRGKSVCRSCVNAASRRSRLRKSRPECVDALHRSGGTL